MFGIAAVFIIAVVYLVFAKPYGDIYERGYADLPDADSQLTAARTMHLWNQFPILFIICIAIYMIAASMRSKGTGGY